MRKLAIAAAVSFSLASVSSETFALGLGEIEIFSALNQSLDAEIGLVSVAPGELATVNVRLADEDAFSRAGLQMTPVLRSLRFDVEQRPDGAPIIKVYSDAPVVEPFLNFLVEAASSTSTSQMREYTLLLDPPAFAVQQQPVEADPVATLDTTDVAAVIVESPLEELSPDLVVGLDNDVVLSTGTQVDLTDVGADQVGPTVVFTEQSAGELDSDAAAVELPIAESVPLAESAPETGGQEIDLGGALIDSTEPSVDDESGSVDVALDELAIENAIFSTEAVALNDSAQNIVDLEEIAKEDPVDALADDVNLVSDTVRQQGVSVSLDPVEPGSSDVETVDQSGSNVIPEVTLETVQITSLSGGESDSGAGSVEVAGAPASEQAAGLDVDLSGIDDSDASLPVETAEDSVVQVSEELPLATTVELAPQQAEVATDSDGQALDISGVIVEVSDAVESPQPEIADNSPTIGPDSSFTYRVQREDTLWSISRWQKPAGVSTNEMMRAIADANPQAFVNGDMNTMREGAVLTIPGGAGGQVGVDTNTSPPTATVTDSVIPDTAAEQDNTQLQTELAQPAVQAPATQESAAEGTQISSDLDEVNKKMMLAQEELTAEAQQRDELSNRVVELEDNLSRMKELITLRESELSDLETEMTTPSADPEPMVADVGGEVETDVEVAQNSVDEEVRELQDQINENTALAQERVDAQADADRNLASAQAEAKSLRLANEEDALRQQLAQLQLEKEELVQSAQADKLELVRQAEQEKAQLLENASAERERILASLEQDKLRIAEEAATERARIAAEAEAEKERLIAEVQAERDRLAAEGEEMRSKLEALEAQNSELVAQAEIEKEQRAEATRQAEEEQARLLAEAEAEKQTLEEESTRVKDKLAELQAEANANLATSSGNQAIDRTTGDTDADGTSIGDLAVPALVGGGLAAAPLERQLGDRKKVLAAGGGVALLGLLGAWAARRRKPAQGTPSAAARADLDRSDLDIEDESLGHPAAGRLDDDNKSDNQIDEIESDRPNMGQAAVTASAVAAAAGAAVVSQGNEADEHVDVEPVQEHLKPEPVSEVETDHKPPMVEEVLVDDTITEADVYLRYGLHGQAEDLLKTAIDKSPDVPEYQVKLMESYHDQKNTAEFKSAAEKFRDRFGESSSHWEHIAELGRALDSSDTAYSRAGVIGAGAAAVGAELTDDGDANAAAGGDTTDVSEDAVPESGLDDTIDAAEDFDVSDLEATGDISALTDELPDDLDEISLDEVDMAALDDDGTLNLEELTGDQMSGLDLGTLDLTNPEGDSTLDNLTLDDADLNSLGDVTSGVRGGLSADIDLDEGTISRTDEMETMLDLAKAYIDMGDSDSAESALKDIITHGSDAQKMEAQDLLSKLR